MFKCILVLIAVIFTSCSRDAEPIKYGKEECAACKMTIMDKKFGAEIISVKGKIYKFDDLVCMVKFINGHTIKENDIREKLVVDYQNESTFINAELARYYVGEDVHSPMNGDAAAFSNEQEAQKFQNGKQGVIMEWADVCYKLN